MSLRPKLNISIFVICIGITLIVIIFTRHLISSNVNLVYLETQRNSFNTTSISTPPDKISKSNGYEIIVYQSKQWRVTKHHPSGYINISFKARGSEFENLDLNVDWRKHSYLKFINENSEGKLIIATYDLIDNLPSGRRLEAVIDGIDVYSFNPSLTTQPERIARGLPIGGMDTQIYGFLYTDSSSVFCGNNICYSLEKGKTKKWNIPHINDFEFVEVTSSQHGELAAILRKKFDEQQNDATNEEFSQYWLTQLTDSGTSVISLMPGGIPYELKYNKENIPIYQVATNPQELRKVFYYDFNRLGLPGVLEFASNNMEGRIAWSQVYYLHALISIVSGKLPLFQGTQELSSARLRSQSELKFLQRFCKNYYPGFHSSRYSMDREPLIFALHLGRIAALLNRADELGIHSFECGSLSSQMVTLHSTVENIVNAKDNTMTMKYRYGYPFWADGANVPYNYISGYVEGLLSIDSEKYSFVSSLMSDLYDAEFAQKYPDTWHYWGGVGNSGWTRSEQISLNTPQWQGQDNIAHISYRNMDAKAFLSLARIKRELVPPKLIKHFRMLTEIGRLLPDMNEYWVDSRLSEFGGRVYLNSNVAHRYARSTNVYELQSQPWALDQLSSVPK
jgi:hypothetical protein